jgi:hypothetical protein
VGITTVSDVDQANLMGNLTRAQAAKMLSQFAIQSLGKMPDTQKSCNYPDISGYGDLTSWMETSCQLGIMGVGINAFDPDKGMSRAEFGTVLSRILRGDTYSVGATFYEGHLNQLKKF